MGAGKVAAKGLRRPLDVGVAACALLGPSSPGCAEWAQGSHAAAEGLALGLLGPFSPSLTWVDHLMRPFLSSLVTWSCDCGDLKEARLSRLDGRSWDGAQSWRGPPDGRHKGAARAGMAVPGEGVRGACFVSASARS